MRSENRLLDAISFDGALQLQSPSTEFAIHYLVGSQTLISLSENGKRIPNRNKTTWPNTDARLNTVGFYGPGVNQKIAIREMGG